MRNATVSEKDEVAPAEPNRSAKPNNIATRRNKKLPSILFVLMTCPADKVSSYINLEVNMSVNLPIGTPLSPMVLEYVQI